MNEVTKGLSSPEVQAKYQKLQETFNTSVKKLAEQTNELAKSFGVTTPPGVQKAVTEIFDEIAKAAAKIQVSRR